MFDERPDRRMSANERDVLLASSGELSLVRRLFLRRRLRRDPNARALAETLEQITAVTALDPALRSRRLQEPRRSYRPKRRAGIGLAAPAAIAIFLGMVLMQGLRKTQEQDTMVIGEGRTTAPGEPFHVATTRLRIATSKLGSLAAPAWSPRPQPVATPWMDPLKRDQ